MNAVTHLVLADHVEVLLGELLAVLVLVDTLDAVALLELRADDTGLHSLDPRLADVLLALLERLCCVKPGARVKKAYSSGARRCVVMRRGRSSQAPCQAVTMPRRRREGRLSMTEEQHSGDGMNAINEPESKSERRAEEGGDS